MIFKCVSPLTNLPQSKLKNSVSALAIVTASMVLGLGTSALAQSFVVPNGQTDPAKTMANDGDTGVVETGGTIDTTAIVAIGVDMQNTNQSLTNAGDILTLGLDAYGVNSTGANATINSSGEITTGGIGAHGIRSTGSSATISNSGEITTGTVAVPFDNASGIVSEGDNSTINNSGTINTFGTTAHGISSTGLAAKVTNTNTINTGGANAHGLQTTNDSSSINNSGTINTLGFQARGVQSLGQSSSVVNSGTINTAGDSAHGLESTKASTTVINRGTINTLGMQAHGIESLGDSSALSNSGSINTAAVLEAFGIRSEGDDTSISNSGSINTLGLRGHGIVSTGANATIVNTNAIRTGGLEAQGINSTGDFAKINNSGTIFTSAIDAEGISATGTNSQIVNSGHVKSPGTAILFGVSNNVLTLLPGSIIEGAITFAGGTDTLVVGNGLSINNTFDKEPEIINSNGAPFATSGDRVAVVDPTNLSTQDEQLADLTGGISSALENRLSGVRNGSAGVVTTSGPYDAAAQSDPGHPFWIEGFGSYRQQEASSPAVETQQWVGGFVIGADDLLRDDLRAGFFGGAAWGGVEADFDSQETDSQSFFVGSYASLLKVGLIFDLSLTAGYSDFEQDRSVANNLVAGGLETATADFSGWFVSPELTVTKPTVILGRRLEGSLALRYAGLFVDGYTESGTTAPLTVDDRNVHIGVARLQLAAPYENIFADGSAFRYRLKTGVEARTNFGGETIDGALLGQNISFNPGGDDNTLGGYVGLSGEYDTGGGLVLSAGTEGLVDTTGSYQFSGRAGAKFRF
ncbi:MAG: autotransporter domain-containing protein [Stappiaceae bacterium]